MIRLFIGGLVLSSMVLGMGGKAPSVPADTKDQLSVPTPKNFRITVVDRGSQLPILREDPSKLNVSQLPQQHQFWVIDSEQTQDLVSLQYMYPLPSVDFEKYNLIFLFQGIKRSGGYHVTVSKVQETDRLMRLWVKLEEPGENCMTTQSLTTPYEVLMVTKPPKRIVLMPQRVVVDCP